MRNLTAVATQEAMPWDEVELCGFESCYRNKDNAAVKEQIMPCA